MSEKIRLTGPTVKEGKTWGMDSEGNMTEATIEVEPIELKRQLSKLSLIVVCTSVVEEQPEEMPELPKSFMPELPKGKEQSKETTCMTCRFYEKTVCKRNRICPFGSMNLCVDWQTKEKPKPMPEVPEMKEIWYLQGKIAQLQDRIKRLDNDNIETERFQMELHKRIKELEAGE